MKKRIISAVVLLPIVFYALAVGGLPFLLAIHLATILALYEFYKAFKIDNKLIYAINIVEVILLFSVVGGYFTSVGEKASFIIFMLPLIFFIFTFTVAAIYVLTYPKIKIEKLGFLFLAQFYIVFPMIAFVSLDNLGSNFTHYKWLVLVLAFSADTMAMFFGKLFGKKKLVPVLSPAKTVAGAVGSVIGTGVILVIVNYIFKYARFGTLSFNAKNLLVFLIVGMIGSLFAQIGDLVGSAFKRQAGIKDFGNTIPGHGGVLDRLDSIIFTSMYVFIIYAVTVNFPM